MLMSLLVLQILIKTGVRSRVSIVPPPRGAQVKETMSLILHPLTASKTLAVNQRRNGGV